MRETNLYAQQKAKGKPAQNESAIFFDVHVVGSCIKEDKMMNLRAQKL